MSESEQRNKNGVHHQQEHEVHPWHTHPEIPWSKHCRFPFPNKELVLVMSQEKVHQSDCTQLYNSVLDPSNQQTSVCYVTEVGSIRALGIYMYINML